MKQYRLFNFTHSGLLNLLVKMRKESVDLDVAL